MLLLSQSACDNDSNYDILSCAPSFNQHDYDLCLKKNLITQENVPVPIDESGRFNKEITGFEGIYYLDAMENIIA